MGDKVGDMRVWHHKGMEDGNIYTARYNVDNIDEGIHTYKAMIGEDLNNPLVTSNAFGLEIVESDGIVKWWEEYYDGEGRDINEIILDQEAAEATKEETDNDI